MPVAAPNMRRHPPMNRSRDAARAFTLLEIMVVVGIAALVMTISIPFVQRTIRRDSVVQAIRTVEDACHSARAMAIFGNGAADLVISMAEGTFRVQPSSSTAPSPLGGMGTDPETGAPRPAGPQPKPFQGSLGEDAVIELLAVNFVEAHAEDEAHVRFHPNGTSDEFTMVVRVGTKAWRKFTLDIMTGLPKTEIIR